MSIGQVLMLGVVVLVFAFFGVGAVYAYNTNLRLNLPINFIATNCTITFNNNTIYNDGTITNPANTTVEPAAADTLQITYDYPGSPVVVFNFGVSSGTIELISFNAYGTEVELSDTENGFVKMDNNKTKTVTLTIQNGITLAEGDDLVFQIKVA